MAASSSLKSVRYRATWQLGSSDCPENALEDTGFAYVISGASYHCFSGRPHTVRRPDVRCVRKDRLPFDQIGDGFLPIRPDLAVEVISPDDKVYELEVKLDDYKAAGIPLVWLVYPNLRRIRVNRLEGPPSELGPERALTGEEIFPGFRCLVADLFVGPTHAKTEPGR